jgi:protein-tyrosine-phosphatase
MGEGLIRAEVERLGFGDSLAVGSAGTWAALEGTPPTEHALFAMQERGIDISDVRSREIDAALVEQADLILAMQESHRIAIETEFPEARGKVLLMSALAGGAYDIADPVGGTLDDYRATANEIARLVAAGWPIIAGAARPASARDRRDGPSRAR